MDLEHFYNELIGRLELPSNYESMSIGEKFQYLPNALLDAKERTTETRNWSIPYFMRFLYDAYPPTAPRAFEAAKTPTTPIPLNKLGLLFEPQTHDEVVFLFSKLHTEIGFPYITQIQTTYPDIQALDNDRTLKRIEIETFASQFNHDPKGCDVIVCWENDLEAVPEGWVDIIQLKDFL